MTVGSGVNIFRKMDDGRMLQVAWRPNMALANELIRTLAQMWPALSYPGSRTQWGIICSAWAKSVKNSGPARSTELAPCFIVSLAFDVLRRGSEEHLVGFRLSELSC